jgi:hypothetical protein
VRPARRLGHRRKVVGGRADAMPKCRSLTPFIVNPK